MFIALVRTYGGIFWTVEGKPSSIANVTDLRLVFVDIWWKNSNALIKRIHENVANEVKKAVKSGQLKVQRSSSSLRRYKLKTNLSQTKKTILQIRLKR